MSRTSNENTESARSSPFKPLQATGTGWSTSFNWELVMSFEDEVNAAWKELEAAETALRSMPKERPFASRFVAKTNILMLKASSTDDLNEMEMHERTKNFARDILTERLGDSGLSNDVLVRRGTMTDLVTLPCPCLLSTDIRKQLRLVARDGQDEMKLKIGKYLLMMCYWAYSQSDKRKIDQELINLIQGDISVVDLIMASAEDLFHALLRHIEVERSFFRTDVPLGGMPIQLVALPPVAEENRPASGQNRKKELPKWQHREGPPGEFYAVPVKGTLGELSMTVETDGKRPQWRRLQRPAEEGQIWLQKHMKGKWSLFFKSEFERSKASTKLKSYREREKRRNRAQRGSNGPEAKS